MNRNFNLRFGGQSLIGKLSGSMLAVVLCLSVTGCPPFTSSGTETPQVTIQNARASREPGTDLPVVTIDYTVKYPSDLYAQTLPTVPTLTCTMTQGQLTRTRTFTGAPVSVTGTTSAPQRGQVSVRVPEDGKHIGGEFCVTCELKSDRTLGTSQKLCFDVPKLPEPCPSPLPVVTKKCPWTPEGYTVHPCTTGFCWDGGPQGALACKQEQTVPNSGRTYTTDLVCNEGYKAERDRCTGVILRCVKE